MEVSVTGNENKLLLLVEDQAVIALSEAQKLEHFGYSVLTTFNGEEAIRTVSENDDIDLILMDIDLGAGIDGTEAARRILNRRDLPIVFLTSHSERDMVERVRGITRYGYVIKNSGDFVLQSSIEMAFELFNTNRRLQLSESRLRSLVTNIPDLVWLKDVDGVYVACNRRFEEFFGQKEADIVGKTDYDYVDKQLADFFRANDRIAMEAGRPVVNEEWITFQSDGTQALLETKKTPIYTADGKISGVLGIGRDITNHRNTEEALRVTEQRYHSALNNIPDVIIIYDKNMRIQFINKATTAITGLDPEEILGRTDAEIWPELYTKWNVPLLRALETGKAGAVQIEFPTPSGPRMLNVTCVPLLDSRGGVKEVMGITSFI